MTDICYNRYLSAKDTFLRNDWQNDGQTLIAIPLGGGHNRNLFKGLFKLPSITGSSIL